MPTPASEPADLAQVRFDNALALFDEFVQQTVKNADAATLRGLERRFAEQVLIQPSYWSQIKSRSRQIGERLARQFESRCRKPAGWMDVPHDTSTAPRYAQQVPDTAHDRPDTSSDPRDDDERFIVGLVLTYYRRHPQRARTRLLDLLGEVLSRRRPPPPPPADPGARRPHAVAAKPEGRGAVEAQEVSALWCGGATPP